MVDQSTHLWPMAVRTCVLPLLMLAGFFTPGCGTGADPGDQRGEEIGSSESALHTLPGATWTPQGPGPITNGQQFVITPLNPVTGGGHAVAPHPTNPNVIYFGGINAGIWRTDNALATQPSWMSLTDFLPSLNIGALALERNNPDTIIAGTGRWSSLGNDGGSQGEILISRNGGATFSVITDPLFSGQKLSGVVIRGNTLLASAIDFVGLVRSTDGGATWTRISDAPGTGLPCCAIDDLIEDRQNPNRLYTTVSSTGVFRSDNLGATWVNISQNDPGPGGVAQTITASSAARMSTSNDGRAYIAMVTADIVGLVAYTTNGGNSWTRMEVPGVFARGNPFYHFAIGADPTSSNFVYIAGIEPWRRGDANLASGQWSDLAGAGTPNFTTPHVDVRDIEFDANGDYIEVSDGGIMRRPQPRVSADWQSLAGNMQSAEIHEVAYDANSSIVFGGTQDNGTVMQTTPDQLPWNLFLGGDGADVQVDLVSSPGNSLRYSSFQFLGAFSFTTFDANNIEIARVFPGLNVAGELPCFILEDPPQGCEPQFYTPVELNRVDPTRIVFGMQDAVYESFDRGENLVSLGAASFTNELTYGHPTNPDVIYAAVGTVFVRTTAGGALAPTPAAFPTFDARDVVLDPADFQRAYVIGFQSAFVTNDAGASWTDITGNLPSFDPGELRSVEFIPGSGHGLIAVGSNRGVFATATDALGTWAEVGNLPHAPVRDMQYSPEQDLLVAGLLGRGAFSVEGLGGGGDNQPPVALCRDVAVDAGASCTAAVAAAAVDAGSFDPDGDPFTCVLIPAGPFGVGITSATLSCTDNQGATGTCTASIQVGVGNNPACCPAGTNVIVGNSNNNTLNGTSGADCILGLGGQDTINGLGGNDIISGGDGNDVISCGAGNDIAFGGSGQDRISGNSGNDVLAGGDGDDQCFGGDGADSISGGQGQDRLFGEGNNDRLFGNDGDDRLEGGAGDDLLDGSGLHDICIGGPGTDSFLICESQTQ